MTTAPSPATRQLVPDWLEHLAALSWRVLVTVTLGLVLVWLAGVLGTVTASILVALIVAATFAPYVVALRNRGWSRIKAAAAVFLGAFVVIGVTLLLIGLSFAPYVSQLIDFVQSGLTQLEDDLASISVPPDVISSLDTIATTVKSWLSSNIGAVASAVGSVATIVILGGFLTFFLLMDGDKAWVWASQFGAPWQRERISESGHEALARVGGYLRGTAILASTDAISDFIFLWLLGVPLAGPLAVLVFFGGFIPYVGGFVTTSICVLVTLTTQGPQAVVLLLLGITVMNIIQGNLLAPIIYGKTVHIHPAIVLMALPAGAALWGIVGLFAVIPVVALIMAVTGSLIEVIAPASEGGSLIPGWLDRVAQWSWRLLVVLALLGAGIALAVQLPAVVIPIVLAIVIAATLSPLARRLRDRGWRPTTAALAATGGGFLITMAILLLALWQLVGQASQIATTSGQGASSVDQSVGALAGSAAAISGVVGSGLVGTVLAVVSDIAALVLYLVLAGLVCFYFLRDADQGWQKATSRLSDWRRREVTAAGRRAIDVLGGYMIGTGVISAFGAVTQALIMWVLGLPLVLPLAVLSFFGGFIPYIGSFITTGIAFLVTVAVGSTQDIIVMGLFTIVFNIVQGNFVAPLVYGKAVNIHPAIILMAIPAGADLAGVVGMFLVVPFLGVVAATWRTVLEVFGDEPAELPPEPAPEPVGGPAVPAPAPEPGPAG
jgi:putative heme transporter